MKPFVVALLSVAAFAGSASGQQGASRIWITGATIISPDSLDHITEGNVLIDNGRIVSVEREKRTKRPADAAVVTGKGEFLIPGLIDSHVHLASIPGMQFETSFGPDASKPAMVREYFKQLPRSYLYFGYTTLVDLTVLDRQELDDFRGAPLHPDLYDCGPSLPIANGYPMSSTPPPATRFKLFPNFLYDPKQASSTPPEYRPGDHTPTAAVARVKNEGGVCVKTYFERGFGRDRNLPLISAGMLEGVRKAATQAGLAATWRCSSLARPD
jgi:hypothetical protein